MAATGVELATAYVSLTVDGSKIAPEVRRRFRTVEDDADRTGKTAASRFVAGFKAPLGALKKTITASFAVAGAAGTAALTSAISAEPVNDKLAAQLGLSEKRSEQIGRVAGKLYSDAYGESLAEVNTAIGSVMSSLEGMRGASGKAIRATTAEALDFATAFEVDVQRAVQVAGGAINVGLAKDATEAFDLIVTASQRVPASLREDVLDAVDEYGQFFTSLGYDGESAFATLVKGAERGMFGIDKAGDAVKEFTIRATDMSTASQDAYKLIGLDAREMANAILAGGDDAQQATQRIIAGLLSMESPSRRANAAIALFGTPLEDLGVREIPKFLQGLQSGSDAMDGFRGNAERMGTALNDNAAAKFTSFKRTVQTGFVNFIGGKALPIVDKIAARFQDTLAPALLSARPQIEKAGRAVMDILVPAFEAALPRIQDAGRVVVDDLLPALQDFLPPLVDAAGSLVDLLLPALSKVVEVGAPILTKFAEISGGVFDKLSDGSTESKVALGGLAAVAAGYTGIKIGTGIADKVSEAKAKFDETKETLVGFKDGLLNARDQAVAFKDGVVEFGGTLKAIPGQISSSVAAIRTQAAAMVSGTKTAATWAATQARAAATSVASAAKSAAAWVASTARTAAALVAQGAAFVASRAVMLAGAAATGIVTAAQWALNAAMTANPIGLVVVAIAALVGGLVLAYKKSETFRKIVDGAFRAVQKAASFAFGWVKKNWPLLLAIITGPIGLAVLAVVKNWDKIKAGAEAMWTGTKRVFTNLVGWVTGLPGRILDALGDLGSLLKDAGMQVLEGFWNGLKDKWEDIKGWFGDITDAIPFEKGPPARDRKLLDPAGRMIMAGLLNGLKKGEPGLRKYLGRVTNLIEGNLEKRLDAIAKQLKNKSITKAVAKDLERAARAQAKSLTGVVDAAGKELGKLAKAYDRATANLKAKVDARASMLSSISTSIQGELDLGSLITTSEATEFGFGGGVQSVSFSSIAAAVSGLAARAKRFAGKLRKLLKAGIPKGLVQEVAGLGSQQGILVADALLSGTSAQISSLAGDYRDVKTNADAVGDVIAGAFYDKSIKAQENLIKGLLQKPAIRKAAKTFASTFTTELLAALGVKAKDVTPRTGKAARYATNTAAARTVPVPRLAVADTTGRSRDLTAEDLFSALKGIGIHVEVGASSRTKAHWYREGKKTAEEQK